MELMDTTPIAAEREQSGNVADKGGVMDQDDTSARPQAVIYLRVGRMETEGEDQLATQRELCEAYAEQRGFHVAEVFEDRGISGTTLDRPGLNALRLVLGRGAIDVVVVSDRDRLSR